MQAEEAAGVIPIFIGVPGAWPLEEGVGPLGGEARLVLAPQHPVGQRELDLGVLRGVGRVVRRGEPGCGSSRPPTALTRPAGALTWNCFTAGRRHLLAAISSTFMTWIEWARARCLAPMSRSAGGTGRAALSSGQTAGRPRAQVAGCTTPTFTSGGTDAAPGRRRGRLAVAPALTAAATATTALG